jgi:hypothetical protein
MAANESDCASVKVADGGLYQSATEALKSVCGSFDYWTERLTETSLQMAYAVMAGNWLIFGSVNGILSSAWSKLSLLMVLLALATNVVGAWLLSHLLQKQIIYAECNREKWQDEFMRATGQHDPWPFTMWIEKIGQRMREIKAFFTLVSGMLLICGAIFKR